MSGLTEWIEFLVTSWVGELDKAGYLGIFILMAIESSVIPLPSEVVMLPAGALVADGKLTLWGSILAGTVGSLAGSLVNYCLAIYLGRALILRFGRYVLLTADKFQMVETYWDKHGEMTTFVGRLLPVVRHLISLPAGLARMNLFRFCLFTTLGAALWVTILTVAGYLLGHAAERVWEEHKTLVTIGLIVGGAVLTVGYVIHHRSRHGASVPAAAVDQAAE